MKLIIIILHQLLGGTVPWYDSPVKYKCIMTNCHNPRVDKSRLRYLFHLKCNFLSNKNTDDDGSEPLSYLGSPQVYPGPTINLSATNFLSQVSSWSSSRGALQFNSLSCLLGYRCPTHTRVYRHVNLRKLERIHSSIINWCWRWYKAIFQMVQVLPKTERDEWMNAAAATQNM